MKPAQPQPQRSARVHSRRVAGVGLLIATSLLMAACGGSGKKSSTAVPQTAAANTTPNKPPVASSPSSLSLAPKGNQLMFDTNNLTASPGKVRINFTNGSALSHSVVLVDSANKVLGQTPAFDGGTKSFSVSLKPGTYTYYCSVPGHRQAGMQGTLTVK